MKNIETERKFLVNKEAWTHCLKPEGERYLQGYLCIDETKSIRVRIAGERGVLTIKGAVRGISRDEFEYPIPAGEATELLRLFAVGLVEKIRFKIPLGSFIWEVDVFYGSNEGLIVAEIELGGEDDDFERPEWLGGEVTGDPRYQNSSLALRPFLSW